MTAPALEDDRRFLTDGRQWLNSRQAAVYCGYTPTPGVPVAKDREMRRFLSWAHLRGLHVQPGRSVYRRADLDAAITRRPVASTADLEAMRRLAQSDAADARRRSRMALQVRRPVIKEQP